MATVEDRAGGLRFSARRPCSAVAAQTRLPTIYVDAPEPDRARAVRADCVTVTPDEAPLGALPVVTDQFATVTVIPRAEIGAAAAARSAISLFDKPGITGSSFAPGRVSRPIVRGLDNYRVRILENGLAVGACPISSRTSRAGHPLGGPARSR